MHARMEQFHHRRLYYLSLEFIVMIESCGTSQLNHKCNAVTVTALVELIILCLEKYDKNSFSNISFDTIQPSFKPKVVYV